MKGKKNLILIASSVAAILIAIILILYLRPKAVQTKASSQNVIVSPLGSAQEHVQNADPPSSFQGEDTNDITATPNVQRQNIQEDESPVSSSDIGYLLPSTETDLVFHRESPATDSDLSP